MQKKIMANEATIKTATVEIKAITIGAKQMTLAVFRQLEQEDIIDRRTGDISGTPWGRVNYCSKDCATLGEHMHILWQKENELRHGVVRRDPDRGIVGALWARKSSAAGDLFLRCVLDGIGEPRQDGQSILQLSLDEPVEISRSALPPGSDLYIEFGRNEGLAIVRNDLAPSPPWPWTPVVSRHRLVDRIRMGESADNIDGGQSGDTSHPKQAWKHNDSQHVAVITLTEDGLTYQGNATEEELDFLADREAEIVEILTWTPGTTERNRAKIEAVLKDRVRPNDLYALRQRYLQADAALRGYEKQWETNWKALAATDQLFIAV